MDEQQHEGGGLWEKRQGIAIHNIASKPEG